MLGFGDHLLTLCTFMAFLQEAGSGLLHGTSVKVFFQVSLS